MLMKSSYRFVLLTAIAAAAAVLAPAAAGASPPSPWGTAIQVPGPGARGMGQIFSMSCASAGNCAAGGYYLPKLGTEGFVAVERNGQWGKAIEVPGLAALNVHHDAYTSSVSCAPAGSCAAVGNYNGRSGHQVFVTIERNGRWNKAIEVPGLAALDKGGPATVFPVSCGPAGSCAAVGTYTDGSGHDQGFAVVERNGRWGKATELPGLAALNKGGSAFAESVSCAPAGRCAAGGFYTDGSGHRQGFVAVERNGRWGKAQPIRGMSAVGSLSCASAGNCSATGGLFVVSERNGRWGTAIPVPGLAALNTGGKASIGSVSCASAGNCAASGSYRDRHHRGHAFVVSEQNGRWGNAIQVPDLWKLNLGGQAAGHRLGIVRLGRQLRGRRDLHRRFRPRARVRGQRTERPLGQRDPGARTGGTERRRIRVRQRGLVRPGRQLRGQRALPGRLR